MHIHIHIVSNIIICLLILNDEPDSSDLVVADIDNYSLARQWDLKVQYVDN